MSAPDFRIQRAVRALSDGGVIACPTEAVWGLSCDPWNEKAVSRLLAMKARPWEKGVILVAGAMDQFSWLLEDLSRAKFSQLELSWPGPTTWLVPHGGQVPDWICGEHDTVAIRVSAHPVVRRLCLAFGGPLVSTSANMATCQPARAQFQVWRYFGAALDDIVPGLLGGSPRPSTIRDLETDEVVRPA